MTARVFILLMIVSGLTAAQTNVEKQDFEYSQKIIKSSQSFAPKNGYVPNAETASAIAYAVALPIYGKQQLDSERPFRTELSKGIWTVLGTLNCKSCVGGTLVMQIDQRSGKILFMTHTQ